MKYKHASQTAYQQIFLQIIVVWLQFLELNNKFPYNNDNFRKNNQNSEEPMCKVLEPKNKQKLKGICKL